MLNGELAFSVVRFLRFFLVLTLIGYGASVRADAGLLIDKTRLVFPAASKEETLYIHNVNSYPVMVQNWIDDGDIDADLGTLKTPLLVVPPLFKLQPNESKSVRVILGRHRLPADRESVFWLNVQMIPPVDPNKTNGLAVSVRTRMKVFYRPESLIKGGSTAWIQKVTCSAGQGSAAYIECVNPTPYYATVDALTLSFSRSASVKTLDGFMLAPYDRQRYAVSTVKGLSAITLSLVNDDGYVEKKTVNVRER